MLLSWVLFRGVLVLQGVFASPARGFLWKEKELVIEVVIELTEGDAVALGVDDVLT